MSDHITKLIADLENLREQASEQPWDEDTHMDKPPHVLYDNTGDVLTHRSEGWGGFERAEDAKLAVAAVNALPDLLGEIARLRAQLAAATAPGQRRG